MDAPRATGVEQREGSRRSTWSAGPGGPRRDRSPWRDDRGDAEGVAPAATAEPPLSDDITASSLDADARRDLRGLQKDTADTVARHLVAAGRLVDEDPERALQHARYARRRASRIATVREATGIAAYHAGEWAEALSELRAARRMGGGPGHLAVMADIERALGRPERALDLARSPEARELDRAASIELTIVAAGARRDRGELDAAVVGLQVPELDPERRDPWSARLFYAYADNLLAAGRESDALQWFVHALDADEPGATDAADRIAELTGEELPGDDVDFDVEDVEDEAADDGAPGRDLDPSAGEDVDGDATPAVDTRTDGGASEDVDGAPEAGRADEPAGSAPVDRDVTVVVAPAAEDDTAGSATGGATDSTATADTAVTDGTDGTDDHGVAVDADGTGLTADSAPAATDVGTARDGSGAGTDGADGAGTGGAAGAADGQGAGTSDTGADSADDAGTGAVHGAVDAGIDGADGAGTGDDTGTADGDGSSGPDDLDGADDPHGAARVIDGGPSGAGTSSPDPDPDPVPGSDAERGEPGR